MKGILMFTAGFLSATAERALKTFCQALAALLVADGTDVLGTDWPSRLSVAGMAAIVSVLTSVGSSVVTHDSGPSLTTETLDAYDPRHNAQDAA